MPEWGKRPRRLGDARKVPYKPRKSSGKRRATSEILEAQKVRVLEELRKGMSVTFAREQAGIPSKTLDSLRKKDEAFAEAFNQAWDAGIDVLEDEARRRAVEGYEEDIFQKGVRVGHRTVYSDRLLEILLRRRRPDQYGPAGGAGGSPLNPLKPGEATDMDVARRLAFVLAKAGQPALVQVATKTITTIATTPQEPTEHPSDQLEIDAQPSD